MGATGSAHGAKRATVPGGPTYGCGSCAHFLDHPAELERLFRGLVALSSAYGSTRGSAGVCLLDGTFRDPAPACGDYKRRGGTAAP